MGRHTNPITAFIVVLLLAVGATTGTFGLVLLAPAFRIAATLIASTLKIANAWQKFIILRADKLQSVKDPGLFMILSIVNSVAAVIDEHIQATRFNVEQALTKGTVPVNVGTITFWHVHDAQKVTPAIADYRRAIDHVAQAPSREMIGASMLSALLPDRKAADEQLRVEIGGRTAAQGVTVSSVEVRGVAVPVALQDAMSRQAQAEHEKQARAILGSVGAAIVAGFVEAADMYEDHL